MRISEVMQRLVPTSEACGRIADVRSASIARGLGQAPVSSCASCDNMTAAERQGVVVTAYYERLDGDTTPPQYEESAHAWTMRSTGAEDE